MTAGNSPAQPQGHLPRFSRGERRMKAPLSVMAVTLLALVRGTQSVSALSRNRAFPTPYRHNAADRNASISLLFTPVKQTSPARTNRVRIDRS
jgi:hypothetical protein